MSVPSLADQITQVDALMTRILANSNGNNDRHGNGVGNGDLLANGNGCAENGDNDNGNGDASFDVENVDLSNVELTRGILIEQNRVLAELR